MALYETVFITRQDMTAEDVDNLSQKFEKMITDANGTIVSKEYWGLKNLAFKIKKNNRGHYVLLNIDAEYSAIAELNRVMGFNEDVIRSATFAVETHKSESYMFQSASAKDYKAGKIATKKELSKLDLVIDQFQFDA